MITKLRKLQMWGSEFGNKHKWFSFVTCVLFVGLALFKIDVDNNWQYVIIVGLITTGMLTMLTFPQNRRF